MLQESLDLDIFRREEMSKPGLLKAIFESHFRGQAPSSFFELREHLPTFRRLILLALEQVPDEFLVAVSMEFHSSRIRGLPGRGLDGNIMRRGRRTTSCRRKNRNQSHERSAD